MQTNMIPGESPNFEDLINIVKDATEEYNQHKYEV